MRLYTKEIVKKIIPSWVLRLLLRYRDYKKYSVGPKRNDLLSFELHLADHCNLNCKSCSHFSPLLNENFLDINIFKRDCQRLAQLSGGVAGIVFMGGEPLLHKGIVDILNIGREYFPKATLDIVTNGITLPEQSAEFWETCKKNNIYIRISQYPIKINRKEIKKLAKKYNVKVFYTNIKGGMRWYDMHLDVQGNQNATESFRACVQSNSCVSLYNGKFYTCSTIPYIRYLNKYFDENFEVTEDDYIDIYKTESIDEILDFLCQPVPFCRYCNPKKKNDIQWDVSKRDRREWIDD